ncbi:MULTISPECIES: ABC transporter substrate-binding protein [Pseudovibrio]|uniref:ABC transporter substrate-binding protein n=1 Tax=Stappiaceae TaxID=2821832 RepID=UPI0023670166|nr:MULTISPECIES: ABC transporter substrate-binding protein [Pseudovibrio]MDD7910922.1 ABC transporter substrate-binding protein [Pseudovibrio exalbescens]MDX5593364.1 ABC transporter substrate-binding protein [Pseudovibrio sp. SPO723]
MRSIQLAAAGIALSAAFAVAPAGAAEAQCEIDRPVVFAGLDWDSNAFHNSVAQFILENGYGCQTDSIPGSTIPMLNGMVRGDIDVTMEVWKSVLGDALPPVEEAGKVVNLGVNFPDALQAWFIPKYLVEGEDAPAKGLTSVYDLPKYKEVFADPEEPGMGRFYNCVPGWGCEVVNTKKMHAYGLTDDFVNFRPGTGASMAAAIESSILRKKPIVFYYWGPTWVLGKVQDQLVQLEEPEFDQEIFDAMNAESDPTQVKAAVETPLTEIYTYANTEFAESAPQIVEFLKNYETTSADISKALAYMQDTGASTDEAAVEFLKNNRDAWASWVPADVKERVEAALNAS